MSQETALAQTQAAPLAPERKSLLVDLANAAGLDPTKYYATIKSMCGCNNATDEHFAALMMVAQGLQLNPILRELYLMPTQRGPAVVVPIDGYLAFLQRAEGKGIVEWHEYEEGWWDDQRVNPADRKDNPEALRRGGRVTAKFKGKEKLVTHTEWYDEVYRETSVWKGGESRQLMHKTYRQFCRYRLGFSPMDVDDAERMNDDTPRRVEAVVTDSRAEPSIPLPTVQRKPVESPFPPAPADLETEPQREAPGEIPTPSNTNAAEERHLPGADPSPDTTQGNAGSGSTAASAGAGPQSRKAGASSGSAAGPSASPASPEFDRAESARIDAEEAAEQKKRDGLFE